MRARLLLLVCAALFALPLFAQNEVTAFLNTTKFRSTSFTDPDAGNLEIKFGQKTSYGVGFNHYLTPNVSADFAWQKLRGKMRLGIDSTFFNGTVDVGSVDMRQIDGILNYHFAQRGAIDPYVGAGVARVTGTVDIDADPAEDIPAESVRLDSKYTWVADAGVNFKVAKGTVVNLSAKYTRYNTGVDAAPSDPIQDLKLDPLTINLGLHWRY